MSFFSTVTAMEKNSKEKQPEGKKNSLLAFFKNTWRAVKNGKQSRHQGNKEAFPQPVYDTDSTDPQPGPSGLRSTALRDQTDPQPGPAIIKVTNCDGNPVDPEPAQEKQTKMKKKGICKFFKRKWQSVKTATKQRKKENKGALAEPNTDADDPQLGPSILEPGDHDQTLLLRTQPFPGLCTLPFSELYEVEEDIGKGFFGTVSKGIRKSDGKQVAIKFITKLKIDRYVPVPGVSKPMFAEVGLNLLLNQSPLSPYVVHMVEWFEEEDRYILVQEYSEPCQNLFEFIFRTKPDESQCRSLMYQAVLGAKHCLDRGVFHRDIKLDNIVINPTTNQIKLIDFGCGDVVKSCYVRDFLGFACPPEYFVDYTYKAEPTTVWSLGIMMYGAVCKRPALPNTDGSVSFDSSISTEFQDLIGRCLSQNPNERATMVDILQHEWLQKGLQELTGPHPAIFSQFQGATSKEQCFEVPLSELYEVEEEIGKGYFATVHKGIRKSDGQQVAIKFTTKHEIDRYITVPGVYKQVVAEVALNLLMNQAPLSPYVVHMVEWFEEEDRYILVQEYSEPCQNLFEFVFRTMPNESQCRSLMYQTVLGAKHCLDRGVFHHDIKLDNFVINTATNQVKLIDFGIGHVVKSSYTGDFITIGCPPEYFADFTYKAEPTTVWSLGLIMYEAVCKCPVLPNKDGSVSFDSSVSTEFQDLIGRCLAQDPAERATVVDILQHEWFQQGLQDLTDTLPCPSSFHAAASM